jgi:hypothetical protein
LPYFSDATCLVASIWWETCCSEIRKWWLLEEGIAWELSLSLSLG